jgi:hypothetical protein
MSLNHRKFDPTRKVNYLASILRKGDAQGALAVFLTLVSQILIALRQIEVHANLPPPKNVIEVAPLAEHSCQFDFGILPRHEKILRINILPAVAERKAAAVERVVVGKEAKATAKIEFTKSILVQDTEARERKIETSHTSPKHLRSHQTPTQQLVSRCGTHPNASTKIARESMALRVAKEDVIAQR